VLYYYVSILTSISFPIFTPHHSYYITDNTIQGFNRLLTLVSVSCDPKRHWI